MVEEQQLREHLDQLADAISDMSASAEDKERLSGLITDIEQQLNASMLEQEDTGSLVEQVDNMVSSFEADHPTISAILNNIMVTLSSMGV